ncbi:shikimate kinase [Fretibacter rubidus]|uniref:shikimate kinase n=1 Tax=Fretibacter rubidus TaxID=570162 RepID=UPI003529F58E
MPPEPRAARKGQTDPAQRDRRNSPTAKAAVEPQAKTQSQSGAKKAASKKASSANLVPALLVPNGPIALVGLMGVGKTTVGRRLAKELGRPFYDSDDEIEKASGRTVAGYFRDHGEDEFRAGERRVIDRLLDGSDIILATGGGAFIQDGARDILQDRALTIFLKGDFETIFARVRKKDTRPLLKVPNPRETFEALYKERYPIYEQAHIVVNIAKGPHDRTVQRVAKAIDHYVKSQNAKARVL